MHINSIQFNSTTVEWQWQGKAEVLSEKPVPVPLYLPKTPHGLTWDWTWVSVLRLVTEPWHSQILTDWFNSMKLHQLRDLYEMLIVKCNLESLQTELFVTHFEIFQHSPARSHKNKKYQSMQLAPQLIFQPRIFKI